MKKVRYDDKRYLQLISELERVADEIYDMEGSDVDTVKDAVDTWADSRQEDEDEEDEDEG